MGISIALRENQNKSYFRDNLLKIINIPSVNEIVLSSGYFDEIIPHFSYGRWSLTKYSVLEDKLWENIEKNGSVKKSIKIVTIGGMLKGNNQKKYIEFVLNLERYAQIYGNHYGCSIVIDPYVARNMRWHAKVAIGTCCGIPLAGIIGSSNLTGPAYGEKSPPASPFNYECDVTIWCNDKKLDDIFFPLEMDENISSDDLIWPELQAILRERTGYTQPDEFQRLDSLYKNITNKSNLEGFWDYIKRKKITP